MKYYLIVGEASGDLHAAQLMKALQRKDPEAEFRFFGGDNMSAVGGTCVRHYKDLAYMGFIPVLMHLRTIMRGMDFCKNDIMQWQPDVVIPVDYAGFNLNICKFLRETKDKSLKAKAITHHPSPITCYYISPKIWAWKEWRIKAFKRDVDEMFCILPFEVDFFEKKHHYPVHYVGNPTADEVRSFRMEYKETLEEFGKRNNVNTSRPIIAILAGSRRQEIKDNLPTMLRVTDQFPEHQAVIAGAPSIDDDYYKPFIEGHDIAVVHNETYALLSHSRAALVTSGTATLETALFNVPQVVCYKTPVPHLTRFCFNHFIKCDYISLVNLIADKEIVPELFADKFSTENIALHLASILPDADARQQMLKEYEEVHRRLGNTSAPENAAREMMNLLKG